MRSRTGMCLRNVSFQRKRKNRLESASSAAVDRLVGYVDAVTSKRVVLQLSLSAKRLCTVTAEEVPSVLVLILKVLLQSLFRADLLAANGAPERLPVGRRGRTGPGVQDQRPPLHELTALSAGHLPVGGEVLLCVGVELVPAYAQKTTVGLGTVERPDAVGNSDPVLLDHVTQHLRQKVTADTFLHNFSVGAIGTFDRAHLSVTLYMRVSHKRKQSHARFKNVNGRHA